MRVIHQLYQRFVVFIVIMWLDYNEKCRKGQWTTAFETAS